MQHVEVSHVYDAPIERVWERYTDHRGWTRWARVGRVTLAREGTPTPDGVGCVRRIVTGGFAVEEEVTAFEPPRRMTYTLVRGAVPMRNHAGEVLFEPLGPQRTRVTWRCRFDGVLPGIGPLVRLGITRLFATVLARLERAL